MGETTGRAPAQHIGGREPSQRSAPGHAAQPAQPAHAPNGAAPGAAGGPLPGALPRAARRESAFTLPPGVPRSSRLATVVLGVAFGFVLVGVWVADRALGGHLAPSPTLRVVVWVLGLTALGAVAFGLAHERRLVRRIAERSAELERLSAELMRVNRAKSEFLANVSHELRTPLNAIVGFVELLQDGVYGELAPRQVGPVQRISGSATHLRALVDQILDLARIAAGRLEVHPERVELRTFVFGVATEMESLVQEKGLQLSLAVPASLPVLRTDPTHLRQILVNLLANAVKFTPTRASDGGPGRITVRAVARAGGPGMPTLPGGTPAVAASPAALLARVAERFGRRTRARAAAPDASEGPWIALQVVDSGVGIPPDALARIFDEFEQVGPRTGDGAERGTGLGLAISRRLARELGGELTVQSTQGAGSAFTLWLRAG
jgi:signal transduction histidine kinase